MDDPEREETSMSVTTGTRTPSTEALAAAVKVLAGVWQRLGQAHARHDAAGAIAGALAKAKWPPDRIEDFVRRVAESGQDEQAEDRARYAADTAARVAAGVEVVTGWTRLAELIGPDGGRTVAGVRKLLLGPREIACTYDYFDEAGCRLYQVVRYDPKGFSIRRHLGNDWAWGLAGGFYRRRAGGNWSPLKDGETPDPRDRELALVRPILYRLPELARAGPGQVVYIAEGEKDVDNLHALGLVATTNPSGAGKWRKEYAGCLRDRRVVILPDNDDKGRAHAEEVAASLKGMAASVKVLALPGLPDSGDVSHWLTQGGTADKLTGLAEAAPEWGGSPPPWEEVIPLGGNGYIPPFPLDVLPDWFAEWVVAEARATQTPPDLAAMLGLSVMGAALATKFRVMVRVGWTEPTNIFTVTSLPSGDRKSIVFRHATKPVQEYERQERERMLPEIAGKASEHRTLEARLKSMEAKAAKATDKEEAKKLVEEAKEVATELARHSVPEKPQLLCDDITPEDLSKLIDKQGGRMLQAAAEGTAFEIVKGRYSETANFDIYLKGHAGDLIRVNRVGREGEDFDNPALGVALAVQPDVIAGLAKHASMRGRGFLARFLFSLPYSMVGSRQIRPAPMPDTVAARYSKEVLALWGLAGTVSDNGTPAPHLLQFSPEADDAMAEFERWLEPRMADGEALSHLAGWEKKLAGAVARIAGILHVAAAVGEEGGWKRPIGIETVAAAIRLGRYYLLPHALVAFELMRADERLDDARRVLRWLAHSLNCLNSLKGSGIPKIKRSDVHAGVWGGSRRAEDLDPVLELLVRHNYLRPAPEEQRPGPGRKPSPQYEVNVEALAQFWGRRNLSENSDNSENCPPEAKDGMSAGNSGNLPDDSPEDKAGQVWEGEIE
jgi:hypothetical protein